MKKAFAEKRFFEWHEDDIAVSLRSSSGSYGGGSEVLVIQEPIAFRDDITIKVDGGGVGFTLSERDYKGVQCIVQKVTGTLSPGAHAGSYNGQDAYNDMLVVGDDIRNAENRTVQGIGPGIGSEGERSQRCDRFDRRGGVSNE